MNDWPDDATQQRLRAEARVLAESLRLPLSRRSWRGATGNWAGAGRGTSLDFHDQRPYLLGDDPRHVNWQAYARSDQLTMKLFREEVSPAIDLLFDVSASMLIYTDKRERAFGLLYFLLESALAACAQLKVQLLSGSDGEEVVTPLLALGALPAPPRLGPGAGLGIERARLRPGSLRILITDGLYPVGPELVAQTLVSQRGSGSVWLLAAAREAEPDWSGPLELVDCETRERRRQDVSLLELERYRESYTRHFTLWRESCHRHDVALGHVSAEGSLRAALEPALAEGALEMLA